MVAGGLSAQSRDNVHVDAGQPVASASKPAAGVVGHGTGQLARLDLGQVQAKLLHIIREPGRKTNEKSPPLRKTFRQDRDTS